MYFLGRFYQSSKYFNYFHKNRLYEKNLGDLVDKPETISQKIRKYLSECEIYVFRGNATFTLM